ncbi:hypothetical protein V8J88_19150 [Massilia sp. W12]|uniref:hypothetical protein n=1 Tax=Massilia sp. W12 TaxID=3126507 RepID=UPI0030D38D5B
MLAFVRIITTAILLLPVAAPLAATTAEQARQILTQKTIPSWKSAAAQIANQKKQLVYLPQDLNWSQLDDLLKSKTETAVLGKVGDPSNRKELHLNASWLRWKILTDKSDGRYSYVYSHLLGLMKDGQGDFMREAVVFYFHGRLATTVDGSRCKDKSSPQVIIDGYESQSGYKRIREAIEKMPADQRAASIIEAIAIEETVGERAPIEWLCTLGVQSMQRALEQGRKFEKTGDADGQGLLGGKGNTLTLDTSGIKVDMVSPEEWTRLRRKVLDDLFAEVVKHL